MPKSTTQIANKVPSELAPIIRKRILHVIYEETGNQLFLYVRDNPGATVQQVYSNFGCKIKKARIINMCYKTGLTLADLPAEK